MAPFKPINTFISSYPKIKFLLKEKYSIFPNVITDTHIKVDIFKPHFLSIADKASSTFFKAHYLNFKGPFIFANIEDCNMYISCSFFVSGHTSARPNKYIYNSLKKDINDLFVNEVNNGNFTTTLIPTDVKHTCSYGFNEKFIYDYYTTQKSVSFKTPDSRLGDQYEILKSDALVHNHFGVNQDYFQGFDGKKYYSKSNTFIKYLIDNNINYNQIELDFVSTPSAIHDVLSEHPFSFEDSHILKKNVIKS